ncbi:uncharacterized protein LOC144151898 [Haemaphysalis longicornis]
MPQCSVPGCKSRSVPKESGVTFHRFPSDVERRRQWANAVRLPDWKVPKFAFVCPKHFRLRDFDFSSPRLIRLRTDAVPVVLDAGSPLAGSSEQSVSTLPVLPGPSHGTSPGLIPLQLHGGSVEQSVSTLPLPGPSHATSPGLIPLDLPSSLPTPTSYRTPRKRKLQLARDEGIFVRSGTGISVLNKQVASDPMSEDLPSSLPTPTSYKTPRKRKLQFAMVKIR